MCSIAFYSCFHFGRIRQAFRTDDAFSLPAQAVAAETVPNRNYIIVHMWRTQCMSA